MSKSNIKLPVFLLLFFFALVFIFYKYQQIGDKIMLKTAWYTDKSISIYDTADIQFAAQAIMLMNLYSPLLEHDKDGRIVPGVCKTFKWISETEIEFEIKDNLTTKSGIAITAEDVYLTFKRLLVKQTNTHGDLQNFLCPDQKIESMQSNCTGLSFNSNKVLFIVHDKNKAKFLLPLLTNMDFGIIPKSAISWDSKELRIKDYSETSGPYYIEKDDSKGNHILSVNKKHYHYKENIPRLVQLHPVLDSNSPELLNKGEIDFITTVDRYKRKDGFALSNDDRFNIHQTRNLRTLCIYFTEHGKKNFSIEQRLSISQSIKKNILSHTNLGSGLTETTEFFPEFSEGSLSTERKTELHTILENSKAKVTNRIKISVVQNEIDDFKLALANYPNIEIVKFNGMPFQKPVTEQEDAYIINSDTGFYENLSLISYYLSIENFDIGQKSMKSWIAEYTATDDKINRLEKLREVHFASLAHAFIVPIGISPYIAIARKPWKPNFNKNFAGTPLWMMEKE